MVLGDRIDKASKLGDLEWWECWRWGNYESQGEKAEFGENPLVLGRSWAKSVEIQGGFPSPNIIRFFIFIYLHEGYSIDSIGDEFLTVLMNLDLVISQTQPVRPSVTSKQSGLYVHTDHLEQARKRTSTINLTSTAKHGSSLTKWQIHRW